MEMSFSDFAKRQAVDNAVITRAVRSGRLRACLGHTRTGRQCITDPELADKEFEANRGQARPKVKPAPAPASRQVPGIAVIPAEDISCWRTQGVIAIGLIAENGDLDATSIWAIDCETAAVLGERLATLTKEGLKP